MCVCIISRLGNQDVAPFYATFVCSQYRVQTDCGNQSELKLLNCSIPHSQNINSGDCLHQPLRLQLLEVRRQQHRLEMQKMNGWSKHRPIWLVISPLSYQSSITSLLGNTTSEDTLYTSIYSFGMGWWSNGPPSVAVSRHPHGHGLYGLGWAAPVVQTFQDESTSKAGHLVQKVLNGGLIVVRCGKSRSSRIPEYGCLNPTCITLPTTRKPLLPR